MAWSKSSQRLGQRAPQTHDSIPFFWPDVHSNTRRGNINPEMHTKRCFLAPKSVSHQLHQAELCVLYITTGTGLSEIQSAQTRNSIKAKKTPVNLKLRHIWKCCSYYSNQQSLAFLLSKAHAVHSTWCFQSPLTITTLQSFLLPSQKHLTFRKEKTLSQSRDIIVKRNSLLLNFTNSS